MKKLKVFMAAGLICTMTVPVFAGELSQSKTSGTMNVTYGVDEAYTIAIPDSLGFSSNLTQTAEVSVKDVLLPHEKTLKVTMTSLNGYKLINEGSEIVYTVEKDATPFTAQNTEVLSVNSGDPNTTTTAELTFKTTEDAIAAATLSGIHTDTLTFTASVN